MNYTTKILNSDLEDLEQIEAKLVDINLNSYLFLDLEGKLWMMRIEKCQAETLQLVLLRDYVISKAKIIDLEKKKLIADSGTEFIFSRQSH